MIYDACKLNHDYTLLISNDSNFYEPLIILETKLNKPVIVVNPDREEGFSFDFLKLNKKFGIPLKRIRMRTLENSQLPNPVILSNGKKIKKPTCWQK